MDPRQSVFLRFTVSDELSGLDEDASGTHDESDRTCRFMS